LSPPAAAAAAAARIQRFSSDIQSHIAVCTLSHTRTHKHTAARTRTQRYDVGVCNHQAPLKRFKKILLGAPPARMARHAQRDMCFREEEGGGRARRTAPPPSVNSSFNLNACSKVYDATMGGRAAHRCRRCPRQASGCRSPTPRPPPAAHEPARTRTHAHANRERIRLGPTPRGRDPSPT
jgi:hypothetical protein